MHPLNLVKFIFRLTMKFTKYTLAFVGLIIVLVIFARAGKEPLPVAATPPSAPITVAEKSQARPQAAQPTIATPKPVAEPAGAIPGLAPVDVYVNLTNKGFKKTFEPGNENSFWYVTEKDDKHEFTVTIMGPDANRVESLTASALNFGSADTNELSRPFLAYVGTLTYDGAEPEKARTWIEENVGKNASTTIGTVTFELSARSDRARLLSIAIAKP